MLDDTQKLEGKVIAALENNTSPFLQSVEENAKELDYDLSTGEHFNGINSVAAITESNSKNYTQSGWLQEDKLTQHGVGIKDNEQPTNLHLDSNSTDVVAAYYNANQLDGEPINTKQPAIARGYDKSYAKNIIEKLPNDKIEAVITSTIMARKYGLANRANENGATLALQLKKTRNNLMAVAKMVQKNITKVDKNIKKHRSIAAKAIKLGLERYGTKLEPTLLKDISQKTADFALDRSDLIKQGVSGVNKIIEPIVNRTNPQGLSGRLLSGIAKSKMKSDQAKRKKAATIER
jgi:hypothetical protein